jgi:hypothetical protein
MLTSIYSQADLGKRLIWHAESDLAGSNSHRSSGHWCTDAAEETLDLGMRALDFVIITLKK